MDVTGEQRDQRSSIDAIFGTYNIQLLYWNLIYVMYIIDPPFGYFDVQFLDEKKSVYREAYSFMSGMTQEDVLAYHWDDAERMFEVRDILASSPEIQFHLFLENPLENGYYQFLTVVCVIMVELS